MYDEGILNIKGHNLNTVKITGDVGSEKILANINTEKGNAAVTLSGYLYAKNNYK